MQFHSPWAFLALLIIPVLLWWRKRHECPSAIRFPSISDATRCGRSLRQTLLPTSLWLRVLAMALLVVAVARPQRGFEQIDEVKNGVAIMMVVDRSPSMAAPMHFQGASMSRLDVVKRVFLEFVLGDGLHLGGRTNDLIGIVALAGFSETVCPLTFTHEILPDFVATIQFNEGGTAIGDGIALAAARLRTAEESLARAGKRTGFDIKSKIIVLLTDGYSNTGKRHPLEAAQLAAEWGVKIHTIGVGGSDPAVRMPWPMPGVPPMQVDAGALKQISDITGGRFRMAENAEGIRAVCREIDEMERTEIRVFRYTNYKELFPPLAWAAVLLMSAQTVLACTWFRQIP